MDSLEVIARPHFDKTDLVWLSDIRARRTGHAGGKSRAAPYFTLVFPGADMVPSAFTAQIARTARTLHRVHFRLRSALVVPEHTVRRFHVFLIPDEGFAALLKLHDALHTGPVAAALKPETPYLPHITVATTADYDTARKLAGALNNGGIDIEGHIDTLRVEQRTGETIRELAEIPLAKAGLFG